MTFDKQVDLLVVGSGAGAMVAALRGARAGADVLVELPAQMEVVQKAISTASEAIAERYFPSHATPTWTGEAS